MPKPKHAAQSRDPGKIRAILIDDQLVFRLGLRMYLAGVMKEIEWVGEAESIEDGLALADRACPDLILLDAFLGEEQIGDILAKLLERHPESRILVLANYPNTKNLAQAASSGAHGYVLKTAPPDEMVEGLKDVLRGIQWIQPEMAQKLYAEFSQASEPDFDTSAVDVGLTPRQLEVLRLIAQGLRNAEIASELTISEQTVKTHVAHLLEKLGVTSRIQAARYAIDRKLVDA